MTRPALHNQLFSNYFSICRSRKNPLGVFRVSDQQKAAHSENTQFVSLHMPPAHCPNKKKTLLIDSLSKRSHVPDERSEYRAANESRWEFLQLLQTRLEEKIASRQRIGVSILSHRNPHGSETHGKCKRQRGGVAGGPGRSNETRKLWITSTWSIFKSMKVGRMFGQMWTVGLKNVI